ncbi:hypothetical protein [Microbacterium pseudoresistens]|uniref:ABC transporter ATP-binding protein n=1 Tax=Microbacterium pseudoresistens TaxID=640634 RepID=A0A7Y9JMG2_9MICO|nr:hypothetical protein [Microbacterium pseudoresistens]NYD53991.1 hypothetical protein [Microbacterium pseudoresistens]
MRVVVDAVSKGRRGEALGQTSLTFESGHARFVRTETEQRPAVLGLIASGRMRPDTGTVTIDGDASPKELRRRVALVDAPDVNDPPPNVTVTGVVGEELMFAGLPATPVHARRWLKQTGFPDVAAQPISTVDPHVRVRILCELAALREGVEGIVLVSPDRHGGGPEGWWRIAAELAERGLALLVIIGSAAAEVIARMPETAADHLAEATADDPDPAADTEEPETEGEIR